MPIIAQFVAMSDIRNAAKRLLKRASGGQDIIMDEIASFTPVRPVLGDPPAAVVDAIAEWIANCEVRDDA